MRIVVAVVLCLAGTSSWAVLPAAAQCRVEMTLTCLLQVLNMHQDGLTVLRKIPTDQFYAIRVELLRLPDSPSGEFLRRIANFTDQVELYKYHEAVFAIPPGVELRSVRVFSAPSLTQVLMARNVATQVLMLANCALERIPPSIEQLESLEELSITECVVRRFSFDVFARNTKLTLLDLTRNAIQTVLPSTRAGLVLPVEYLYLSWNRLESVDFSTFASLASLRTLDLSYNSLLQVQAPTPVSWPALDYLSLEYNQLTGFDLPGLSAPQLVRLSLTGNRFTAVPQRLRRFPSLVLVGLAENQLRVIDLAPLGPGLPNLRSLDFSNNVGARSIRASKPVSLPKLNSLYAESCGLTHFNATGIELPAISFISLTRNNFTGVPRLLSTFPSLESFSLELNPLPCAAVRANAELIASGRLILGWPQSPASCKEGYATIHSQLTLCCKAS